MKLDHKDYTNILLFIAVLILLFIIIFKIQGDGVQCTLNPLEYGANQLRELNAREVNCQCDLLTQGNSPSLYFNHNQTWMEEIEDMDIIEPDYPELNVSNIQFINP